MESLIEKKLELREKDKVVNFGIVNVQKGAGYTFDNKF